MESFKNFIQNVMREPEMKNALVDKLPRHGRHTKMTAVMVTSKPVHGSHSRQDLKEEFLAEALPADVTTKNFRDAHRPTDKEWKALNTSYKPQHEDDDGNVHKSIVAYTENSNINHQLLNAVTNKPNVLNMTHEEYNNHPQTKRQGKTIRDESAFNEVKKVRNTQVSHLDHAIQSNRLKREAVVYHGTGFHPNEFASQHPNRHIELPTYVSTSASRKIAQQFSEPSTYDAGHVLRIRLPKGHPALPILDRSTYAPGSGNEAEHEVLLPRNSRFRISEHPIHTVNTKKGKVHIWDAEPV
jgi:hypothetical protein